MSHGKGYLQAIVGFVLGNDNGRRVILVGLVVHGVEHLVGVGRGNFGGEVERIAYRCTADLYKVFAVIAVEVVLITEYNIITDYAESVERCIVVA